MRSYLSPAALWNSRLIQASADFVRTNRSTHLLLTALAAYAALWFAYFYISHAAVDVHFDVSEASIWARTFELGYKHPPMTAWIFRAWFAIFPQSDWAAYLLAVTNVAATLAITWALLQDHLDKDRALVGLMALILVPFYTFLASKFNANTVMMPFWAATVLFYLRARRSFLWSDAVLAGAFAGLTFLGKYWGVYLIGGIVVASSIGQDVRRFYKCGAPFLMAAATLAVLSPHIYWLLTEHNLAEEYLATTVLKPVSFTAALKTSLLYLGGICSYASVPLIFFAFLKPNIAALKDTIWPRDHRRQQALILLVVPLILPAVTNLAWPHRLTPIWAFPNWAPLPIVLYGSSHLSIPTIAAARSSAVTFVISLLAVVSSPLVARAQLGSQKDPHSAHYKQVATEIARLAKSPAVLIGGSAAIVRGLFYYLPEAWPVYQPPTSKKEVSSIVASAFVCIAQDVACRETANSLLGKSGIATDVTFTKTFLGKLAPTQSYRIVIVPSSDKRLDNEKISAADAPI